MVTYDSISWHSEWPEKLRRIFFHVYLARLRVRISYSDWQESGYVGITEGQIKSPILVHNTRSNGGGLIGRGVVRLESSRKGGIVLYDIIQSIHTQ